MPNDTFDSTSGQNAHSIRILVTSLLFMPGGYLEIKAKHSGSALFHPDVGIIKTIADK
jgi:hypothetical protein